MSGIHREIAQWLLNLKLIGPACPALADGATVESLVAVLRDGVVLCQLAHMLDPGCLDMTRQGLFLDTCLVVL